MKAQDFGYNDHDLLMHPHTGRICFANEWVNDAEDWDTENLSIQSQFDSLEQVDYGTVRFGNKTLYQTQQAYAGTDFSTQYEEVDEHGFTSLINPSVYFASAIDEENNEYEVKWLVTNEEAEDESDACDWNDYTVRKL
jgi:hypothetical protein